MRLGLYWAIRDGRDAFSVAEAEDAVTSERRTMLEAFVGRHLDKPWAWAHDFLLGSLLQNPAISNEFVVRHKDKFVRDLVQTCAPDSPIHEAPPESVELFVRDGDIPWAAFLGISCSSLVTPEFIEKHPDKPWNWGRGGLSRNPSITQEFIEKYMDKPWEWGRIGLSMNPAVTPEFVERHPDRPWYWGAGGLSSNPSITSEFVERHLDKAWDCDSTALLSNPGLPLDLLERNFHRVKEWGWRRYAMFVWPCKGISANPTVTPEFVEKHLDRPWVWDGRGLSANPSITPAFIERHLDQDWDWGRSGLSKNPAITPAFVERHLDQAWEWGAGGLSKNPAMTPEFVERHLDKPWSWGLQGLSTNTFEVAEKRRADLLQLRRVVLKIDAIPTEMYAPISAFL